ncbi:MAG: uroporphyrinogen-III C-methyltransferase [Chlamydiota bacterium]|nr:uroporphyrinogen-III C-methyltransferase [Chlamydiota bacterium]
MKPKGKVSLVGAGPGDPKLLTLRAYEVLKRADVVLYDALVNPRILRLIRKDAVKYFVGRRAGNHRIMLDEAKAIMKKEAAKGKHIVHLKGGDPFIFGRGAEEALFLVSKGIEWEVVPGISSATAVPAYAGIPLSLRHVNAMISFVAGHEDPEKAVSQIDWAHLAKGQSTLVFLMGRKRLPAISAKLMQSGLPENTPCALIQWGTLPYQKTITASLKMIAKKADLEHMMPPCIFIAGEVVRQRDKLQWIEKKSLFGKNIVVTRACSQAAALADALESNGANVLELPTIQIEKPSNWTFVDRAIGDLADYDWVVFTSVNAVKIFMERLFERGLDGRAFGKAKIAVIGQSTCFALDAFGLCADLIPKDFVAESLLKAFKSKVNLPGKKILLPRAQGARDVLVEGLKKSGALVDPVVLYRTSVPKQDHDRVLERIRKGQVDWLTFTSSSTVQGFMSKVSKYPLSIFKNCLIASIGPITSKTLRSNGLKVHVEAKPYTINGLVQAMIKYKNKSVIKSKTKR